MNNVRHEERWLIFDKRTQKTASRHLTFFQAKIKEIGPRITLLRCVLPTDSLATSFL